MERVSGNIVEFEMNSLVPATHYTVKVYAMRDSAKSAATSTDFTTGRTPPHTHTHTLVATQSVLPFGPTITYSYPHSHTEVCVNRAR